MTAICIIRRARPPEISLVYSAESNSTHSDMNDDESEILEDVFADSQEFTRRYERGVL